MLPVLDWWGTNWANSAVRARVDGAVALTVGILFIQLVSHWKLVLYDRFTPHSVLLSTSSPMLTFSVRGFSLRCMMVAPMLKSLEKA